jgi:hypothetical protein
VNEWSGSSARRKNEYPVDFDVFGCGRSAAPT